MSAKLSPDVSNIQKVTEPHPWSLLKPMVVVTGGSRGIGAALAERFAKAGHEIAIVARNETILDATARLIERSTGKMPLTKSRDVTELGFYTSLEKELAAEGYFVDVLINNAAIGLSGRFSAHDTEDIDRLLHINIASITRITHAALKGMLIRKRGTILNVASLGGYAPGPGQALYYASKSFVLSLTEALAEECRGTGVRVSALAPGPVATTFHQDMQADNARYRTLLPDLSPEQVAKSAYWRIALGQRVIVPGLIPQSLQIALKLLPHRVTAPLIAWFLSKYE